MKNPIIFKHIPKSGGTFLFHKLTEEGLRYVALGYGNFQKALAEKSFNTIASPFINGNNNNNRVNESTGLAAQIISKYGTHNYGEDTLHWNNCSSPKNIINDDIGNIDLFRAHFMFEELKKSNDYYLLSMIRNPVDMFYSEFLYHKKEVNYKLLDSYINKVDNFRLEYFKNVISTCDFVGVNEYMTESLNYINKEFGFSMVNDKPINEGNSKMKKELYSYRRDEVEDKCSEVLDVYNKYVELFKNKYI